MDTIVREIFSVYSLNRDELIKGAGQLVEVDKSLQFINQKINEFEEDRK